MIFLYLLIVGALGFTVIELLDNKRIISLKKWMRTEYFIISVIFGWLIFTIYMLLLAFLNIKYNFYILFVPIIINLPFALYFICINVLKKKYATFIYKLNFANKCIYFVSSVIFIFIIISFILNGYSHHANIVDEFNYWVLHPKSMFLTGYTNSLYPSYPHFLSYLYSGHYFFINRIANNEIRIIQAIFLFFCYLISQCYASRHKLNKNILSIFFILLSLYYTVFFDISTSTFADISFMFFYSFSCIYLIEWMFIEHNNNNMFLAVMFLMLSVWCKTDGLFLSIYNILILLFFKFYYKKFRIEKITSRECLTYVGLGELIIILWKLYSKLYFNPIASSGALGSTFNIMPGNFIPMLVSMKNQILTNNFTVILLIIYLYCTVYKISKQKNYNKTMLYVLSSFVIINYMFLVVCYLFLFGVEGIFAASFVRYMVHIVPIIFILFDYCYSTYAD